MRSLLLLFALIFLLAGCGGGGGSNGGGGTTTLAIVPGAVTLGPGEEAVFSVAGAGGATWTVQETNGGTISATGRYKAPTTVGIYHVVAAAGGSTATATVTVTDGAFVVLTPLQASVPIGETLKLNTEVRNGTGTPRFSVVEPNGGTVSADGTYTPPATPGTYHVRVDLASNPSSATEATITVTPEVSISIESGPRLVSPGSRLTFKADVSGDDTDVTWTTSAGTIDATGKLIAPDSAGEVTVTATSVASPSKKTSTKVTVIENPSIRFKFEGKSDLIVTLDTAKAPKTSANLVSLVNEGFYTGIKVHRLEPGFVVQWGDPLTKTLPLDDPSIGSGGPGYTIPFETNDLKNVKYSLAMARKTGKDTAGSQIYINLADNDTLDGDYVVFGTAITRMAVNNLAIGDTIVSAKVEDRN